MKLKKICQRLTENDESLTSISFHTDMFQSDNIGPEGTKAIAGALLINTTVTSIDLNKNDIGSEGAKAIAGALLINTTVTSINLNENDIGSEGAKAIAGALLTNSSLTSIALRGNDIGSEGAKALADVLSKNTSLISIDLGGNNIYDDGVKALADMLLFNSSLTLLDLWGNLIRQEGAKTLASALSKNTTLTSIDLTRNSIGDEGAKALAGALLKNNTLTSIYIWNCGIGSTGVKALAGALSKNTSLIRFEPAHNNFGDDGAKALADALLKNISITTLNLWNCRIGPEGAKTLLEMLSKNTALTSLNFKTSFSWKNYNSDGLFKTGDNRITTDTYNKAELMIARNKKINVACQAALKDISDLEHFMRERAVTQEDVHTLNAALAQAAKLDLPIKKIHPNPTQLVFVYDAYYYSVLKVCLVQGDEVTARACYHELTSRAQTKHEAELRLAFARYYFTQQTNKTNDTVRWQAILACLTNLSTLKTWGDHLIKTCLSKLLLNRNGAPSDTYVLLRRMTIQGQPKTLTLEVLQTFTQNFSENEKNKLAKEGLAKYQLLALVRQRGLLIDFKTLLLSGTSEPAQQKSLIELSLPHSSPKETNKPFQQRIFFLKESAIETLSNRPGSEEQENLYNSPGLKQ